MARKPSGTASAKTARRSGATSREPWSLSVRSGNYPPQLKDHPDSTDWRTVYGVGNRDILQAKCLGLICSVQCPGNVVLRAFDAIRSLRDAEIVVAGGFHSPMERECLDFLLAGKQPVIICPAKSPGRVRLAPAWQSALEAGRLLLLSPFGNDVSKTTKANAKTRNEFVSALAAAVLIPHASPGGNGAALCRSVQARRQPLFRLDSDLPVGMFESDEVISVSNAVEQIILLCRSDRAES